MGGVIGIIQARMESTRLPGKILAPLAGRPLLELLVARTARARVDEWWLATTARPADDVTETWGHTLGLRVFRGEVEDVHSRFVAIARDRSPDWIVRLTADDPFTDWRAIDWLLDARDELGKDADLLDAAHGLPLGYAPELVRASALLASASEIPESEPFHRSHVLTWIRRQGRSRSVPPPADWPPRPDWRWTLDTFDDWALCASAFELFGLEAPSIAYAEMVRRLDGAPEILALNAGVTQRAIEEG